MKRPPESSLVIGVATSTAERVRLAQLLGAADVLLLVSSPEQARAFLELTGSSEPPVVLAPATAAPPTAVPPTAGASTTAPPTSAASSAPAASRASAAASAGSTSADSAASGGRTDAWAPPGELTGRPTRRVAGRTTSGEVGSGSEAVGGEVGSSDEVLGGDVGSGGEAVGSELVGGGMLAAHIEAVPVLGQALRLDAERRVVRWHDREVSLTRLEHDFLRCLAAAPGEVWTYERLHLAVWGNEHLGHGSHIHSVVKRLRRKLAALGTTVTIRAVRGIGFQLPSLH